MAAITMIRDEADIIAPFLRHLAAFFDIAILLDQRSSDGTGDVMREACNGRAGWSYHFMDFAGRHQKEVKTHFMATAFDRGADAVFFIDSDEFAAFHDRQTLVDAISSTAKIGRPFGFRLRPCVPTSFDRWHFEPSGTLWIGNADDGASPTRPSVKIAIPRLLFEQQAGLRVSQGNHAALAPDGKSLQADVLGDFYHVPIRSRQQFLQKVFLSAIANFAKHNPMTFEGVHKRHLLDAIGNHELDEGAIATMAAQYPPIEGIAWWDRPVDLAQRGFALGRLETSFADLPLRELPEPAFHRVLARSLAAYAAEDVEGGRGSLVFEPGVVRFHPAPDPPPPLLDRGDGPSPIAPPAHETPSQARKRKARRGEMRSIRKIRKGLARLERKATPAWHFHLTVAAAIVAVLALAAAILL